MFHTAAFTNRPPNNLCQQAFKRQMSINKAASILTVRIYSCFLSKSSPGCRPLKNTRSLDNQLTVASINTFCSSRAELILLKRPESFFLLEPHSDAANSRASEPAGSHHGRQVAASDGCKLTGHNHACSSPCSCCLSSLHISAY